MVDTNHDRRSSQRHHLPPRLLVLSIVASSLLISTTSAAISSYGVVPKGSNPTLYTPGVEPIVHLDQTTFHDTVFGTNQAHIVEFYADWCGHCRAFAPYFRSFADSVSNWQSLVAVSVINCADTFNQAVCRENSVSYFPMMKYFPRTSRRSSDGTLMETPHSAEAIRDELAKKMLNDYNYNRYADWPPFSHIQVDGQTTYGALWEGAQASANHLAIVFEQYDDGQGAKFMLDMAPRRGELATRRALASSPLSNMLRLTTFPSVAVFTRSHQQALYIQPLSTSTYADINQLLASARTVFDTGHASGNAILGAGTSLRPTFTAATARPPLPVTTATRPVITTTTASPAVDCKRYPERCAELYFVSETDMLKAMRMALLDEVTRTDDYIEGANFTALYDFVHLLSHHFPVLSFTSDVRRTAAAARLRRTQRSTSTLLRHSERARLVFSHLREYLASHNDTGRVSAVDWRRQFENVERVYSSPFPTNASWQHCAGSTGAFRGYTCGLWTTFHALTVHTYIDTIKDDRVEPLKPLLAIRGWVRSFFGCAHCRNHFLHMTGQQFPMNERRVRHAHDMMTYLWRAHNIVNHRLHGDPTEDPHFIKYQFPPVFLCPTCHSGGQFSRRQVRSFLLRYYGSIRPHSRQIGSTNSGGTHRRLTLRM